jgi:hypothetical protein
MISLITSSTTDPWLIPLIFPNISDFRPSVVEFYYEYNSYEESPKTEMFRNINKIPLRKVKRPKCLEIVKDSRVLIIYIIINIANCNKDSILSLPTPNCLLQYQKQIKVFFFFFNYFRCHNLYKICIFLYFLVKLNHWLLSQESN